jgi:hypothetical protein
MAQGKATVGAWIDRRSGRKPRTARDWGHEWYSLDTVLIINIILGNKTVILVASQVDRDIYRKNETNVINSADHEDKQHEFRAGK